MKTVLLFDVEIFTPKINAPLFSHLMSRPHDRLSAVCFAFVFLTSGYNISGILGERRQITVRQNLGNVDNSTENGMFAIKSYLMVLRVFFFSILPFLL